MSRFRAVMRTIDQRQFIEIGTGLQAENESSDPRARVHTKAL
jgi:hypothetical protein